VENLREDGQTLVSNGRVDAGVEHLEEIWKQTLFFVCCLIVRNEKEKKQFYLSKVDQQLRLLLEQEFFQVLLEVEQVRKREKKVCVIWFTLSSFFSSFSLGGTGSSKELYSLSSSSAADSDSSDSSDGLSNSRRARSSSRFNASLLAVSQENNFTQRNVLC
jgi:hypothetical protein